MVGQNNRRGNDGNIRGNSKNSLNGREQKEAARVYAPYNFVEFPKNPVYIKDEKEIIGHNVMTEAAEDGEELFSGEINYTLEAMTPVFVDDGTKEHRFCRNAAGKCIIPGSTMRGLIRSHASVLGLGNVRDDIDDYSLMFRDVAGGLDSTRYKTILGTDDDNKNSYRTREHKPSIPKNVCAGYIEKTNEGKFVIYRTELDPIDDSKFAIDSSLGKMNYYTVSEKYIIELYLSKQEKYRESPELFPFSLLIPGMKVRMMNQVKPFRTKEKGIPGIPNNDYIPYNKPISYKLYDDKNISAIKSEDEAGKKDGFKRGVLVSSGYIQKKKVIYVIPEIDHSGDDGSPRIAVELSDEDVRDFKIDYNRREKSLTLKKNSRYSNNKEKVIEYKAFFDLPRETGKKGRKPVFYTLFDGRCYFGFTPRLRLFYDQTVAEGISKNHVKGKTDLVKAIFGYTEAEQRGNHSSEKESIGSRKTRVSFTDAVLSGIEEELPVRYLTLSEPRPTHYLNYLKQSKIGTTYNSVGMELRGTKQYWLHKEANPGAGTEGFNEKLDSAIKPLNKESRFQGKIRFKNLRKHELGLLLWSIRLEEDSWMNLGKAKAYGYGAMRLVSLSAWSIDYRKAYGIPGIQCNRVQETDSVASLFSNPYNELMVDELIDSYKNFIRKYNGNRDIEQLQMIQDFFAMKDSRQIPEPEVTRYMELEQIREQKRAKKQLPLPLPGEVLTFNQGKASIQKGISDNSQSDKKSVGISLTGKTHGQNEKINAIVFLAGYPLSDAQKKKLETMSGLTAVQVKEWPNDENVTRLAREYNGIALPSNVYPTLVKTSKRHCDMVFKAKKTGRIDDGWTEMK